MRNTLLIIGMLFFATAGWSQATGKVYIDDHAMDVPSGKPDHFAFDASKSTLDESGTEYLKYFIESYNNNFPKAPVYISIVPNSNGAEKENDKTAVKRIEAIEKILKKTNIQILRANFKDQIITCKLILR